MFVYASTIENIIYSSVILVFCLILVIVLVYLIKLERKRYLKDKLETINDITTFEELIKLIEHKKEQKGSHFQLMYLSVDQFDQIATYIEEEGVYSYLLSVGKAIQMSLPRGAKFAQTKERETFLIYLPELLSDDLLYNLAVKFQQATSKKMKITDDLYVKRQVTIGMTRNQEDVTFDRLFLQLKQALYHGKRENGNQIILYNEQLNQNEETLKYYKEMKDAIKEGSIKRSYLPIFDTYEDKCYGFDVKYTYEKNKEEKDFFEFMPLLEETGDAFWLNTVLLEQSLEDIFDLYQQIKNKTFYFFLPTSLELLRHEDAVYLIDEKVKRYQYDSGKIILYVPLLKNQSTDVKLVKNVMALKNLGYHLSMDHQTDVQQLIDYTSKLQIDFLRVRQDLLKEAYEPIKSYLGNTVEIVSTNVTEKAHNQSIVYKDISYYQSQVVSKRLRKEDLQPYVSKNR